MAVASLAAILKPQILSLMQGGKEEGREKREKELSLNQSGLLDTVSRHAAAMAQIKSWQYKRLQNKEAEKKDFFSLSPLPYFSLTSPSPSPLPPPQLAQHLTQGAARGQLFLFSFFYSNSVLRNANLTAEFMPGPVLGA